MDINLQHFKESFYSSWFPSVNTDRVFPDNNIIKRRLIDFGGNIVCFESMVDGIAPKKWTRD